MQPRFCEKQIKWFDLVYKLTLNAREPFDLDRERGISIPGVFEKGERGREQWGYTVAAVRPSSHISVQKSELQEIKQDIDVRSRYQVLVGYLDVSLGRQIQQQQTFPKRNRRYTQTDKDSLRPIKTPPPQSTGNSGQ